MNRANYDGGNYFVNLIMCERTKSFVKEKP